jgi:indolepyruvate ferredoxin oxidoreductase beta subunit
MGNARAMNIVLLGATVRAIAAVSDAIEGVRWDEILRAIIKPAFVELNTKAFARGFEL